MDKRANRVAKNESTFRRANEQIEKTAQDLADDLTVQSVPFLCECAEARCTNFIRLTLAEYEDIRSDSRRFAVVPGHEVAAGNERVVSQNDRFTTVEKVGEAGRIVAESDPR